MPLQESSCSTFLARPKFYLAAAIPTSTSSSTASTPGGKGPCCLSCHSCQSLLRRWKGTFQRAPWPSLATDTSITTGREILVRLGCYARSQSWSEEAAEMITWGAAVLLQRTTSPSCQPWARWTWTGNTKQKRNTKKKCSGIELTVSLEWSCDASQRISKMETPSWTPDASPSTTAGEFFFWSTTFFLLFIGIDSMFHVNLFWICSCSLSNTIFYYLSDNKNNTVQLKFLGLDSLHVCKGLVGCSCQFFLVFPSFNLHLDDDGFSPPQLRFTNLILYLINLFRHHCTASDVPG